MQNDITPATAGELDRRAAAAQGPSGVPQVAPSGATSVELRIRPSQVAIAALTILAVLGAVLLVMRLIDVLILLFVGLVIAATLRPLVMGLQRLGIPKALALFLIYLGVIGALVGLLVLVVPAVVNQGGALIRGLPQLYASLVTSLEKNPNQLIRTLPQRLPSMDQLAGQLQAVGGQVVAGALGIGAGILGLAGQLVTILVLGFYLTMDQSRLERFWLSLAPTAKRPELLAVWREIESRLGSYVRAELLLMLTIGVLASLGYLAIGLPYALALGALAGLLEFIPMLGPTLGAIPAVIVALSISPQTALFVVLYSIAIQVAENQFIVPRMMGHSVGVSPLMVILSIIVFSSLLGITGAFLAIPLAAIFQVVMDHLVVHAGPTGTEEPVDVSTGGMSVMRARIRRLRGEVLQRLRTRKGYVALSEGDVDEVDSRVDQILANAESVMAEAAQTVDPVTREEDPALFAQLDEAINQVDELLEPAETVAETEPNGRTEPGEHLDTSV